MIDVDLVRGSTFPKAKPKQSLLTVLYLSILRYFFLPLYARWWVKETSAKVFVILISLYMLQMVNFAIYSIHVRSSNENEKVDDENLVPLCELLIPMGLSMLLCFVHSQIVATAVTSSRSTSKRRQKLNLNRLNGDKSEKVRRKKKALRQRPTNNSIDLKLASGYDTDDEQSVKHQRKIKPNLKAKLETENHHISCIKLSLNENSGCSSVVSTPDALLRRRNVNWDSPIKTSAHLPVLSSADATRHRSVFENVTGDDGFESLTGKSSSGEDNLLNQPNVQSDSDTDTLHNSERSTPVKLCKKKAKESSDTDEENDDIESFSPASTSNQFETTDGEYIGVTSNSESECSVDHSDEDEMDAISPTTILTPNDSSEKVSCTLWSKHEAKKAEMSVLEISTTIIQRVESIPETCDYVYIGLVLSLILSLTPTYCRLCDVAMDSNSTGIPHIIFDLPRVMMESESNSFSFTSFMHLAFGQTSWEKTLLIIATLQRLVLAFLFFFLLAVAERTFKQR